MFAICIESSHEKGMGHLFRALNLIKLLKENKEDYIVLINNDGKSILFLKERNINLQMINLQDYNSDWESDIIKNNNVQIWINDRLDTDIRHSINVKKNGVKLITFDDEGSGAEIADMNFGGLALDENQILKGKCIYRGIEYLILNQEINKYKRVRTELKRILVTLGGSDTYGVTLNVVDALKRLNYHADILIGPSFLHQKELNELLDDRFRVKTNVPSLIEEFCNYDLAITAGGITPFEANASGLPCIIIATEIHEIKNGRYLQEVGCSKFIGYRKNIDIENSMFNLNIEEMSTKGIKYIRTNGVFNVYSKIKEENNKWKNL